MERKTIKNEQIKADSKVKIKNCCVIYHLNNNNINGCCNISIEKDTEGKHIYYIFENVDFTNGLFLSAGENTHIIFKNCSFHKSMSIHSLGEVVFESNQYYADENYPTFPQMFFTCNSNNLRFTNECFLNAISEPACSKNIFGISIDTKFLMIEDSFFRLTDYNGSININAFETIIFDSSIDSTTIRINSDDIYTISSSITASNEIDITNKNSNEIEGVKSATFIYNGKLFGEKRISLQK